MALVEIFREILQGARTARMAREMGFGRMKRGQLGHRRQDKATLTRGPLEAIDREMLDESGVATREDIDRPVRGGRSGPRSHAAERGPRGRS